MPSDAGQSVIFEKVVRGNGKLYALVRVPDYMLRYGLHAFSKTRSGNELPAAVVSCPVPGRCIVVMPTTSVSQVCTLECEGVEVARKTFNPRVCQAESGLSSRRRDAHGQLIRNWDGRSRRYGCAVKMARLIRAWNADLIVHGVVQVDSSRESDLDLAFDLRFLDAAGESVSKGAPIIMKDVVQKTPDDLGAVHRTIEFSVRVDSELESLTIWAHFEDGTDGFACYEPPEVTNTRNGWIEETREAFSDMEYDTWFKDVHAASDVELQLQSRQSFEISPVFSIIVPLYNTPPGLFGEMLDSVLSQTYGNFELVLVNSTPDNEQLARAVDAAMERDSRVKCVDLEENRGITENTNAGIAAATGDFLCFLDHDDLLTPDALYWYVRGINDYPETDLLYSDEDKVKDGWFLNPYFKPDWNPDLLTSMNYICHFLCVRASVVDELESATSEFDGSQDHHMALRVSERARNIYHARRVLYHWRIVEGSTADTIGAKPYALEAGVRAVQAHLDRCGLKGTVGYCPRALDHYEVHYELESRPLVSILVPNKDNAEMLDRCVRSILDKSTYDNFEVVIVENNSVEPETFSYYERLEAAQPRVRVIRFDGAFNFAAINNFAVRESRGDYLLLLNNDTEVITADWIERMLALCMRKGTGAVGARLLFPDGTIQHAGIMSLAVGPQHIGRFSDGEFPGYACMYVVRQDLSAVTGACLMTSRAVWESIGGMDEQLSVAYNDIDYCYALRDAGLLVVYEPGAELYHYESVSRGSDGGGSRTDRFVEEQGRIRLKWPRYFSKADPYGNPHFKSNYSGAYYQGFE